MKLVSVFHMGGSTCSTSPSARARAPNDLKDLEGKTILLGSAGWQSIADPMLRGGRRHHEGQICRSRLADLGHRAEGRQGRRGARWEGLRAQWKGQGLDFDYLLGRRASRSFPAEHLRHPQRGLRRRRRRRTAAPALSARLGDGPRVRPPEPARRDPDRHGAVPRPRLADDARRRHRIDDAARQRVPRRLSPSARAGAGRTWSSWDLFLKTIYKIGQVSHDIDPASVIKNDYIAAANDFDKAKLAADAQGYKLPPDYQSSTSTRSAPSC